MLPSAFEPNLNSAIISSALDLSLFKMTFSMTNGADGSVVLAELRVALFRECSIQRLSLWDLPLSCSPDLVSDLS